MSRNLLPTSSNKGVPDSENDFFGKKQTNEIAIINENKTLKKEIAFLDNINLRLGKELTDLQLRFNVGATNQLSRPFFGVNEEAYATGASGAVDYSRNIVSVNRELSFFEPLLMAYDDKVEKMERLLETLYDNYRDQEKKVDCLVQENNTLAQQLETKCLQILSMHKEGSAMDHLSTQFLKVEREDLNDRINTLSEENKELFSKLQDSIKQCNDMNKRCDDLQAASEEQLHQLLDMSEKCKEFEMECAQLRNAKEVLENKMVLNMEQQAYLEGDKSDLSNKYGRAENEMKLLKTQVSNFKRNLADVEERKNIEIDHLRHEIDALKLRDRDACQKMVSAEKELDYLKDESRKILKEREIMKSELEEMIRMMDNYQSKIQSLEVKEDTLAKQYKDAREKLQEAQLQRDKAILSEQQMEKNIENMKDSHRSEINESRDQQARFVENMKSKHKAALEERDDEIEELNKQITSANFVREKLQKENTTLLQEQKKFNVSLKDEYAGGHVNDKVPEYERRINELEEKLQLTEQYHSDRLHSVSMEKTQIEATYRNQQNILSDLKANNEKLRGESSKLAQEIVQLNSRMGSMQKDRQAAIDEIGKVKKAFESKLDHVQTQFGYKMKEAQEQLNEAMRRERGSREKAIELLQTHDRIEEKMKSEYESRIKELEMIALTLKDENKGLLLKVKRFIDDGKTGQR